jgi:hypothetical protein
MAWRYNTPGGEADFTNPDTWHNQMAAQASSILVQLVGDVLGKDPRTVTQAELDGLRDDLAYVDPTVTAPPNNAETIPVPAWPGFPLAVTRQKWPNITLNPDIDDPDGYYRAVEHFGHEDIGGLLDRFGNPLSYPVRDRQDEYLEWAVAPDRRKITFVAEGYDYYSALFRDNEQAVVDIYKEFTQNNTITADDLRAPQEIRYLSRGQLQILTRAGEFNPRNRLNLADGRIIHLSHRANSLGAEINLAGVSSLARKNIDGGLIDSASAEEVICCNHSGAVNRNSDPAISHAAYGLVLDHKRFTLADPVGLYIAGARRTAVKLPTGNDQVPDEWWKVVRGEGEMDNPESSRILRLELEVPEGEIVNGRQMTIFDLEIGGAPARFAGQFAELVDVHLFVTNWERGNDSVGPTVGCIGTCCGQADTAIVFSSQEVCTDGRFDLYPGHIAPAAPAPLVAGNALPDAFDMLRRT